MADNQKEMVMGIPMFEKEYRGWIVWDWSGWKAGATRDFLVAQWLARKGEGQAERFLYSSSPGTASDYRPGERFDIDLRSGQSWIYNTSSDNEKARQQELAYGNLVRLIDDLEDRPK
jgi:hypothetical protein